ncbi:hypothetical protein [Intestinibaculum porci]|uniref:hypothetical protein n=1 Tax=Intestinibaculum porci TaxID=2487118 RepID=UPI00240A89E1|nr:hypothetical protein [Intestinibaculum porci]MDD6350321.1 hypothetical protein [Intestinibaculum porci]MDD6423480.1 hypothetical protein [Intestinibaculum porci]
MTHTIYFQTAQLQKLIDFFDGYKDDQVSCKYVSKKGIKATFEVESNLSAEDAASHCKSVFKATPEGQVLYFSIQPASFFGK